MQITCLEGHRHQRLKFEQKDFSPKIHFQISIIGKLFGIGFHFLFYTNTAFRALFVFQKIADFYHE